MIAIKVRLQAVLALARAHLVDDWHQCFKWATVQLSGALLIINLLAQAMPVFDSNLALLLPAPLRNPATGIYAALMLLARVIQLKPKSNGQ